MVFANQGTQRKAASNRFFVITRWSCSRGGCTGSQGVGVEGCHPTREAKMPKKTHCLKKVHLKRPMLDDVIGLQQGH